jgi:hypothetical protein
MKALIVNKEWLNKIFDEGKIWEMRTTKTKITGRIGLIEKGTGLVVGEVELVGCSLLPIPKDKRFIKYHKINNLDLLDKWKWAWILNDAKRYEIPKKYTHPIGAVIWVNLKIDEIDCV